MFEMVLGEKGEMVVDGEILSYNVIDWRCETRVLETMVPSPSWREKRIIQDGMGGKCRMSRNDAPIPRTVQETRQDEKRKMWIV